jgi:hypothetical protein
MLRMSLCMDEDRRLYGWEDCNFCDFEDFGVSGTSHLRREHRKESQDQWVRDRDRPDWKKKWILSSGSNHMPCGAQRMSFLRVNVPEVERCLVSIDDRSDRGILR